MNGQRATEAPVDSTPAVTTGEAPKHRAEGHVVLAVGTAVQIVPPMPQEPAMLFAMLGIPEETIVEDWIKHAPGYGIGRITGILPEDIYEVVAYGEDGAEHPVQAVYVADLPTLHNPECTEEHQPADLFAELLDGNLHPVLLVL